MVKRLHETFTDEEYDLLTTAKGQHTWREFILTLVQSKNEPTAPAWKAYEKARKEAKGK